MKCIKNLLLLTICSVFIANNTLAQMSSKDSIVKTEDFLNNYFYNQLGCEAVTYEDGDEIDRNIIKKRATVYAKEFMKTMLLKYYKNEL